jgi:Dullard-like phosphatase family protein
MSLKIDTGVVINEHTNGADGPATSAAGSNSATPTVSGGFATPKGGPLPTLLFARKHSMNVPRTLLKSSLAAEDEENKAVASLVTQVNKKAGEKTPPPSRPRTPSSRLSQDVGAIATTLNKTESAPPRSGSSTPPLSPAGVAAPALPGSPKASEGGIINRMMGFIGGSSSSSAAPSSPKASIPPAPSIMSPKGGAAKSNTFSRPALLGEQYGDCIGKKCLVLDLDETLVHSSFKPTKNADFIIPVEIDGITHQVYVGKRPNVDEFLQRMGKIYEIVIFTASLSKYANPLLDVLDSSHKVIRWRLFREHCTYHDGCYVKDLSRLGRPMNETLIVDNATYSYMFQPENAIASDTWNDDPHCMELQTMADYLESIAGEDDLRRFTEEWNNSSSR